MKKEFESDVTLHLMRISSDVEHIDMLQQILAYIAGFLTTFCLGYILWKGNE